MTTEGDFVVRSWQRTVRFRGASAARAYELVTLVDGHTSIAEVAKAAAVSNEVACAILDKLADAELVAFGDVLRLATGSGSRWSTSEHLARPLSSESPLLVHIVGAGTVASTLAMALTGEQAIEKCRYAGLDDWKSAFDAGSARDGVVVLCPDSFTYAVALELNTLAAESSLSWLAGWSEGDRLVVSHVVRFGSGACFECLLQRQRANYLEPEIDGIVESKMRTGEVPSHGSGECPSGAQAQLIAALLALRIAAFRDTNLLEGRWDQLVDFDTESGDTSWSTVLRAPWCPACGASPVLR